MHRWTSLAFGLLFVAAVMGLVVASQQPESDPATAGSASASAAAPSASVEPVENPVAVDAEVPMDAGVESAKSSAFNTLADGGPVPKLPEDAPKRVQIGVVLFQYKGAQGAPSNARSKESAREKAEDAVELAKKDFDEAVKLGDPGSLPNAGDIPRSVLEPVIEYTVFTMEPGAVHPEPLDTPRGYWIVRRIK